MSNKVQWNLLIRILSYGTSSFVLCIERLSSFRGDFLWSVYTKSTFGLSFVGRFVLFPSVLYLQVIFITHSADIFFMRAHKDDVTLHYVTECSIVSSVCAIIKNIMSSGRVLNVVFVVTRHLTVDFTCVNFHLLIPGENNYFRK